ncbi:MAG: hypothetical protein ABIA97_06875 [Candidatus Omnitrophota bacterium]
MITVIILWVTANFMGILWTVFVFAIIGAIIFLIEKIIVEPMERKFKNKSLPK